MDVFNNYAYYYNLIYGDKDYKKEAETVHNIIQKYQNSPINKILDVGCGTGKHDVQLCKLGYKMKGIDLSPQMIKIADENYGSFHGVNFETGNAQTYRTEEKFDAVISLFHVMSYQNDNKDLMGAFETAHCALKERGLFIFDVWYGPGVLTDRPSVRVKKVEDDKNRVIRYAQPVMYPNKNVVKVCYDILVIDKSTGKADEIKEEHNMRYYFYPEIEFYLNTAGFELLACLDSNTLKQTDYESWTCYFVARRK